MSLLLNVIYTKKWNMKKNPSKTDPQDISVQEDVNFVFMMNVCDNTINESKFKVLIMVSFNVRTMTHLSLLTHMSLIY